MPPNGRIKNANANVANAYSVPKAGSSLTKTTWLKTKAATVPYKKKSNNSIELPTRLAIRIFRISLFFIRPPCHNSQKRYFDTAYMSVIQKFNGSLSPGTRYFSTPFKSSKFKCHLNPVIE